MESGRLVVDAFTFDPRPEYPLLVTAKRYTRRSQATQDTPNALTLILTHGTGYHKEQWEPTIEHLWDAASEREGSLIREVWSIDCPNHGDAAVLNENTLLWGYGDVFDWGEYGRALYLLLNGLGTGIPTDFKTHNLVGIGHSMGAIGLLLSLTYPSPPQFSTLIMVEPMLLSQASAREFGNTLIGNVFRNGALSRRDIWESSEEAYQKLSERKAWQAWDPRVLKIMCEHGLRALPSATYPDKKGATLKCTKIQEAACYNDKHGRAVAYNYLSTACQKLPIHAVYGTVHDYVKETAKKQVIKEAAAGRLESVRTVEGAGHLVVQTHPARLADVLLDILQQHSLSPGSRTLFSKL